MLKLDYPTTLGPDICDVINAVIGWVNNLLPGIRKLCFPIAMPFAFVLPPRITESLSLVSPVPDSDFSALCNHRAITSRTHSGVTGLRFLALPVDHSKLHIRLMTDYLVDSIWIGLSEYFNGPRRLAPAGFRSDALQCLL
jgi:hypothetical protein